MPTDPVRQRFRQYLAEREALEASRRVTLAVQWKLPDGSTLLNAGGVWDRVDQRYLDVEPDHVRVIRLKKSQVEAAHLFAWWMQEREAGRPRDFITLAMLGDRGGGKTYLGSAAMVTALIKFPRLKSRATIGWQVCRSYKERAELEREIAENFPLEGIWYVRRKAPEHEYRFLNGALLRTLSADDPESLKQGTVDFLYLNEMAKLPELAYENGLPRIKDNEGLCWGTTNPPRSNRGRWVYKLYQLEEEAIESGKAYPVRFVSVRSEDNDALNVDTADMVATVLRDLNPALAAADIDGKMFDVKQTAYWKFNKKRNIRPLPELGDITREFTKRRLGRAYDYLAGADFQNVPHMAAVFYKVLGTYENPILWAIDEIICEESTEDDLLDAVDEAGYKPENVLWIADASGQWQDGKHNKNRDSFSVFKRRRWNIKPPVKPRSETHRPKNPPIEQRVRLINDALEAGMIMLESAPDGVPKLIEALKECEMRPGKYMKLVPMGFYAHLTDAAGYPAWWVFSKGKPSIPDGTKITEILDRPN